MLPGLGEMSVSIQGDGAAPVAQVIPWGPVFNFGYSGRSEQLVRAHVVEMAGRGVPEPKSVPSLYPIPTDRLSLATQIAVYGSETYAEVEYVLIRSADGWLVTVGADQTDALVERVSVSRAKRQCPDVICPVFWPMKDVARHFDELILSLTARNADGEVSVQQGRCAELRPPLSLIELLTARIGLEPPVGTVVFSGTISGSPPTGTPAWRIALTDPVLNREISHTFRVVALEEEL